MKRRKWRSSGLAQFLREQAFALVLFAAIVVIFIIGVNQTAQTRSDEEMQMAEDSIRRAVVSCYAIEGRYPESYSYLKENYGINVDESKYAVHYEIFASNIMPEITVTEYGSQQ